MFVRKRTRQLKRRCLHSNRCCGISRKGGLHFVSSLILPLMLGVFTVVVTFKQQEIARQHRLEDENESRLQREQDWRIAEMAQVAQNKAVRDRYQDEVLVTFIKEMTALLEKNNGTLEVDSLTRTFARLRILNTIRQLDGTRQLQVLQFLQEAGQLSNTDNAIPIDISKAELITVDFQRSPWLLMSNGISLHGVVLVNSTFYDRIVQNVNFSTAGFMKVNFAYAILRSLVFTSTVLEDVDFSFARFKSIDFSSSLLNIVTFSFAKLTNLHFSFTWFFNVTFFTVEFEKVNFSYTRFSAYLTQTDYTNKSTIILERCIFKKVDFSHAHLKDASFRHSTWEKINFSFSNLQNADFTNTTITDSQLQSALSIRNAKLPNGTLEQARNLIKNGNAHCKTPLIKHWNILNGSITIIPLISDPNQCRFAAQSPSIDTIMSQRIPLIDIWNSSFWTDSHVTLQAQMTDGVLLELLSQTSDGTILSKYSTTISTFNSKSTALEVVQGLNPNLNRRIVIITGATSGVKPSRVIVVSSLANKRANIVFAKQFNQLYEHESIRAYSLQPGGILTNLKQQIPEKQQRAMGWYRDDGTLIDVFKTKQQRLYMQLLHLNLTITVVNI